MNYSKVNYTYYFDYLYSKAKSVFKVVVKDIYDFEHTMFVAAKDEETAHQIVAQCDLGLIPYDENRLYYNIAFPTKLSFYLTAGISYLSTPVKEVMKLHDKSMGYVGAIEEWPTLIKMLSKEEISIVKMTVRNNNNYLWDHIFKKCSLMNI